MVVMGFVLLVDIYILFVCLLVKNVRILIGFAFTKNNARKAMCAYIIENMEVKCNTNQLINNGRKRRKGDS